jgi:hypothetical protein
MSKLEEKPSAFQRERAALQKIKFLTFFHSKFVGHFCPPGSGSWYPIEFGSNPIRIHSTGANCEKIGSVQNFCIPICTVHLQFIFPVFPP